MPPQIRHTRQGDARFEVLAHDGAGFEREAGVVVLAGEVGGVV